MCVCVGGGLINPINAPLRRAAGVPQLSAGGVAATGKRRSTPALDEGKETGLSHRRPPPPLSAAPARPARADKGGRGPSPPPGPPGPQAAPLPGGGRPRASRPGPAPSALIGSPHPPRLALREAGWLSGLSISTPPRLFSSQLRAGRGAGLKRALTTDWPAGAGGRLFIGRGVRSEKKTNKPPPTPRSRGRGQRSLAQICLATGGWAGKGGRHRSPALPEGGRR